MPRRPLIALVALSAILLGGTLEEQRDRLPAPAPPGCADPVAGEWMSHVYFEHVAGWYIYRLQIARDGGAGQLVGTMRADYWDGTPADSRPPSCEDRWGRTGVVEEATGRFDGTTLRFDATEWAPDEAHPCGGDRDGYLLDHFVGTVDLSAQEFQAFLNADAPEWRNVPILFRRVSCGDAPAAVPRPPPPPIQRGWSCG